MALTSFNTKIQELALMQSSWATTLNPLVSNPILNGQILPKIKLQSGVNRIPHQLQRNLVGWFFVRKRNNADVYDVQDSEPRPELFLVLTSDSETTVDIYVF